MRILFTNDDGYDSEGLHAVARLFCRDYDIAVVAPNSQRSGYSHSLTLGKPVTYSSVDGYGYPVYALDGTPVDCVKFADTRLFPTPDVVVSGINRGRNLGSDVMYSGTVSAASDAAYIGIRAFALSFNNNHPTVEDFRRSAEFFKKNFNMLVSLEIPAATLININFPDCIPVGVKWAKMSISRGYSDSYNVVEDKYTYHGIMRHEADEDSDEALCYQGYITVTPLTIDRTDYNTFAKINGKKFVL